MNPLKLSDVEVGDVLVDWDNDICVVTTKDELCISLKTFSLKKKVFEYFASIYESGTFGEDIRVANNAEISRFANEIAFLRSCTNGEFFQEEMLINKFETTVSSKYKY